MIRRPTVLWGVIRNCEASCLFRRGACCAFTHRLRRWRRRRHIERSRFIGNGVSIAVIRGIAVIIGIAVTVTAALTHTYAITVVVTDGIYRYGLLPTDSG